MKLSKLAKVVTVAVASMFCIALLAGCSTSNAVEGKFQFTKDTISGEIEVSDIALTVRLDSNPTTGYEWTYEIDGDAVEYRSDEYVAPESDALGAGGTQVYSFLGNEGKAGDVTITLTYGRPFDDSAEKTVVEVKATTNDKGQFTSVTCEGAGIQK